MNLPFFGGNNQDKDLVSREIAIIRISPTMIQIAICMIDGFGKTRLLTVSEFGEWDGSSDDSLVKQSDQLLTQAINLLPDGVSEPEMVLFGISSVWVEDGKPKSKYKEWMKLLASDLDLKPIGYAITTDAVINFLNQQESAPVTAVVVTLESGMLEVSLVYQGKVQQVELLEESTSILHQLKIAIKRFPETQLPARLILYDGGKDLNFVYGELNNVNWEESQWGFLHLPKIDLLPSDVPIKGLVTAAGQALGSEVDFVESGLLVSKKNKGESVETKNEKNVQFDKDSVDDEDIDADREVDRDTDRDADRDGEDDYVEEQPVESLNVETNDFISPVDGFVLGKDILEIDNLEDVQTSEKKNHEKVQVPSVSKKVKVSVDEIPVKNVSHEKVRTRRRGSFRFPWKFVLSLFVVFGLVVGGGYVWLNNLHAKVLLLVDTDPLTNEFMLTVDPNVQTANLEDGVLPGENLSVVVSGAKSITTTGEVLTGEKATGEITIYNDTEADKSLEAGTVVTVDGQDLEFSLNDDVQIASKTVDLSSDTPFKPGKATVKVTALKIGAEYNVESNSLFSIGNYTSASLLGKNSEAFTGGSSRQVQAVSKTDVDNLSKQLTEELEKQAIDSLKSQLEQGQSLIESSVTSEIIDQQYDQKVGDQANKLSLNMKLKFSGVVYSKGALDEQVKAELLNRVPNNKVLSGDLNYKFELQNQNTEDTVKDTYVFKVITQSSLLPKLNPENIKAKIKGKRPQLVNDYLDSLPSVNQVRYELTPNLPNFLDFLVRYPFDVSAIDVQVVSEDK